MTISEWLLRGEVGISSKTLCAGLMGEESSSYQTDVPYDCDDFRRCFLFYTLCREDWDKYGGWKKILETYDWLEPYAREWDALNRLYGENQKDKLYCRLQLLRVESLRLRYPHAQIRTNSDGYMTSATW